MAIPALWLRYDFVLVPLLLVAALPALSLRYRYSAFWPLSAVVLGFGTVILLGLWSSGLSDGYLIGGIVPRSDAREFVTGALRLVHEGELTAWASRRPVFPSVVAVLLSISGYRLAVVLFVLLALNLTAILLATRAVQYTHGAAAAGMVLAGLLLFYRRYIGLALSENVGLLLGCLGFTLLWIAIGSERRSRFYLGLFLLALGLNARAGAFFILPVLTLWASWHYRGERRLSIPVLVGGSLAVAAAFLVNLYLLRVAAIHEMGFSNFYYGLYGLLHEGSWDLVLTQHPDLRLLSEADRTAAVARMALQDLRHDPGLLVRGVSRAYGAFFLDPVNSAFSFVRITGPGSNDLAVTYRSGGVGGALRLIATRPLAHLNELMLAALMAAINLLALLALVRFRRLSGDARYLMVLSAWLGILISVPFAPPWDASMMRAYATTVPFMIALPAFGVCCLGRGPTSGLDLQARPERVLARVALALGAFVTAIAALAPTAVGRGAEATAREPEARDHRACPPGTIAQSVRFLPVDSRFRLSGDTRAAQWDGRELGVPQFREGLKLLSRRSQQLQADLTALPKGTVVTSAYDLAGQVAPVLALPEDLWSTAGGVQRLCVEPSDSAVHRAVAPSVPLRRP